VSTDRKSLEYIFNKLDVLGYTLFTERTIPALKLQASVSNKFCSTEYLDDIDKEFSGVCKSGELVAVFKGKHLSSRLWFIGEVHSTFYRAYNHGGFFLCSIEVIIKRFDSRSKFTCLNMGVKRIVPLSKTNAIEGHLRCYREKQEQIAEYISKVEKAVACSIAENKPSKI
jgi:hypothetical protein